ncbi:MAG TPA: hypothetical protein VHP33_20655 [Polyangiaceae bacterium]|nr:hypothetical protein [Polyangiaceae bacterium]
MSRPLRAAVARADPKTRRWSRFVVLAVIATLGACVAWLRSERLQALAALKSSLALRVGSTEGLIWPTRLTDVEWEPSPSLRVQVARVELGRFPWQRTNRAHGVLVRAQGPLDLVWEDARRLAAPADLEVADARLEYTDASGRKLSAAVASFEPGSQRDHLHVESLRAFGATFRDLHLWASRPSTALELRFSRDADDSKAPQLNVTRSAGEGVEWALHVPSQPFSEWASRTGLRIDETWTEAVIVGIGSVIVPDSPAQRASANFRLTLDNWHRPSWPESALLTGRSGAIALRVSPGPGATHAITRVEVAAGLFSLVGKGEFSFGEPNRLTFDAQGELSCARLLAHLPASRYRDQVQAYLGESGQGSANETSVRLELAARAEAPRGLPLQFRWHLHAGCGLPEMNED